MTDQPPTIDWNLPASIPAYFSNCFFSTNYGNGMIRLCFGERFPDADTTVHTAVIMSFEDFAALASLVQQSLERQAKALAAAQAQGPVILD
jgi:hypothetical protein